MDDFWVRENPVGVMPVHEGIVEVVYTFRVELILLDQLTFLVDAVPGLDHRLLPRSAVCWVLLTKSKREIQLLQCSVVVRSTGQKLWCFHLQDHWRLFLEEVVDLNFRGWHKFLFWREVAALLSWEEECFFREGLEVQDSVSGSQVVMVIV